jgi:hypothetical protein
VQDPRWELQRIALFAVQPAAANGREVVGGEALRCLSRGRIKGVLETGAEIVGRRWQLELSVGIRPLVLPPHGIIDQMGKGYMPTTFRQIEISRAGFVNLLTVLPSP